LVHLVVIWYIFPVLVCCTEKNLATLLWPRKYSEAGFRTIYTTNDFCVVRHLPTSYETFLHTIGSFLKLPPYTLKGFDLTTHSSSHLDSMAGGEYTTRPRRQGHSRIIPNWCRAT
jgi:hypothetical protein